LLITAHHQHITDAVVATVAGAELGLVAFIAPRNTGPLAIELNTLLSAFAVSMLLAKLGLLISNAHIVVATARWWTVLLITSFTTHALIILTTTRCGAIFSVATWRIALALAVAHCALWALVIALAVDAATKLATLRNHASQLAGVVVSAHTGRE
jgi:hypothetical protein